MNMRSPKSNHVSVSVHAASIWRFTLLLYFAVCNYLRNPVLSSISVVHCAVQGTLTGSSNMEKEKILPIIPAIIPSIIIQYGFCQNRNKILSHQKTAEVARMWLGSALAMLPFITEGFTYAYYILGLPQMLEPNGAGILLNINQLSWIGKSKKGDRNRNKMNI